MSDLNAPTIPTAPASPDAPQTTDSQIPAPGHGEPTPPAPPIPALRAPGTPPEAPRNAWDMQATPLAIGNARFDRDKFFINRKVMSMGGKYFIYDENNAQIFYVDRPTFKVKAHFGVFGDESKNELLLNINQDSALAIINDSFTVLDPNGVTLGQLKRSGWMSMIRRTWRILDASGAEIAHATEDSIWKALIRRMPYLSIIGLFLRTNFNIVRPSGEPVGAFIRRITVADKHVLDLSADAGRQFDRRLAVALALVLDNAESRHQNH